MRFIYSARFLPSRVQAARDGREDMVRAHLSRLPRVKKEKILNVKDADGYAAVHHAAKFNRFKILQLLVTSGASESCRPLVHTPTLCSSRFNSKKEKEEHLCSKNSKLCVKRAFTFEESQ